MSRFSPLVDQLIDALQCLPGVGPKSAQRMAFQLLERGRPKASFLGKSLIETMEKVGHCKLCRNFTETELCQHCESSKREASGLLCVVESPSDVFAVEQTGHYAGRYFVLMGHISPIDGIGPNDIGLDILQERLKNENIEEVILATNPTVEGEATAHYIADICQREGINATRIAHGVPVGGELELVDGTTLSHAFKGRKSVVDASS